MAWNVVPLWRESDPVDAAQRLTTLADAYAGPLRAEEILMAVPERITIMLEGIPAAAAAGDPGMANLLTQGEPERSRRSLEGLITRSPAVLDAIGRSSLHRRPPAF